MSTTPEIEEMPDEEVEQAPPEQVEVPVHGVLVVEGIETGDRRKFAEGAITWRNLPLPLLWAKANNGGHDGSVVVGRIEEITRAEDGTFPFSGFMNTTAEADECIGLLADRSLRGISVDIDDATLELQTRSGAEFDGETDPDDVLEVLTKARVSAATIVPIPAFQEAFAALGEPPATGEVEEVDEEEVVTEFRDVSQQERDDLKDEGKALPDGSFPIANEEDLRNAIQSVGRAKDPEKAKRHIKKRAKDLDAEGLIPDDWAVVTASGDAVAAQSARDLVSDLPGLTPEQQATLDETAPDNLPATLDMMAEAEPDDLVHRPDRTLGPHHGGGSDLEYHEDVRLLAIADVSRLPQQHAVFRDQTVPAEHQVGGRFGRTGRCIYADAVGGRQALPTQARFGG